MLLPLPSSRRTCSPISSGCLLMLRPLSLGSGGCSRPSLHPEAPALKTDGSTKLTGSTGIGLNRRCGPVAQRLEQGTHNSLVPGSNPGGPSRIAQARHAPERWKAPAPLAGAFHRAPALRDGVVAEGASE